jgi:hypothetical protein
MPPGCIGDSRDQALGPRIGVAYARFIAALGHRRSPLRINTGLHTTHFGVLRAPLGLGNGGLARKLAPQ